MIDLLPSVEQQQIIDSVIEYLSTSMPVSRLRPGQSDVNTVLESSWKGMAELGWFGIGLSEADGGVGYTLIEEMLIARELGRGLASPTVAAGMIAAHLAAASGQREHAAGIVDGSLRVGLANAISETEVHLIDAVGAPLVLMSNAAGVSLYSREAFSEAHPVNSLDDAILLERARAPKAAPLARADAGRSSLARRASLLVSAQLVGVGEAAKDLAVSYAKMRVQFGQAIGAFQALKHECADMAVKCEGAHAQTFLAGLTEDAGLADADFQAAVATQTAREAALHNARTGIQIHGGIGFTAECDAHHFLKRAHLLDQLGGGTRGLRRRLLA